MLSGYYNDEECEYMNIVQYKKNKSKINTCYIMCHVEDTLDNEEVKLILSKNNFDLNKSIKSKVILDIENPMCCKIIYTQEGE